MKRITPEEVVEAYKVTGYKPIRMGWFIDCGDHCEACGLTVCSVAIGKNQKTKEKAAIVDRWEEYLTESLEISTGYLRGFVSGFDGYTSGPLLNGDAYIGFNDGVAAAQAVFQGSK
jgi:hypothetical protein